MKAKRLVIIAIAIALPVVLLGVLSRQKSRLPTLLGLEQQGLNVIVTPDERFLVQGENGTVDQLLAFNLSTKQKSFLRPPSYVPEIGTKSLVALRDSHRIAGTGAQFEYLMQTSIAIYDLQNPKNFKLIASRQVAGPALAASPIDDTVAAFNSQGELCFWNATSGRLLKSWKNIGSSSKGRGRDMSMSVPQALAFSPDGALLAVAGRIDMFASGSKYGFQSYSAAIDLRDVKTGSIVRTLEFPANPANLPSAYSGWPPTLSSLQFSPDGKWLATACHGAGVAIWKVVDGQIYGVWFHPERVTIENGRRTVTNMFGGGGLTFSPDSRLVAAASNYAQINVWQIDNSELVRQIDAAGPLTFLKNGKLVASSRERQFMVFSVP